MGGVLGKKPAPEPPVVAPEPFEMTPTMIAATVVVGLALVLGKKKVGVILLHVLGLVLVLIDFALYVLTLGPLYTIYKQLTARTVFAAPFSEVDINGKGKPPSKVWRSVEAIAAGKLEDGSGCAKTAYEMLCKVYKEHAARPAQGMREYVGTKMDDGYKFPAKVFGMTSFRTFGELGELAHAFGAGLRGLGLEPQAANAKTADHKGVLIYEDTCADWMLCAQGCFSQDIAVATSYATLGVDSVVKAVVQGGVLALICNRKAVPGLLKMASSMPTLKCIIYTDHLCTAQEAAEPKPSAGASGMAIYSVMDVVALGKKTPYAPTPPSPDSLAVLMYTSGSTGDPKGVMVLQRNLISMTEAVKTQFTIGGVRGPDGTDTYLGYLPLAHILEMVSEFYMFSVAGKVCYADPKSLLAGPERCYPAGAFDTFHPTMMCGVPKVWEGIRAGALAKVAAAGPLAAFLIGLAIKMKALATKQHRYTPLFKVLLKKFKRLTGGQLKATLSGGGAISAEVQEWCRTALDAPLVQGYGLTETTGGTTIQMADDMSIGIAGTPLSSAEVTLHSELEITDANGKPYMATDTVHSSGEACAGRGEVWMRGANLTAGYYKMPELTAEEYGTDGWFHTGDIGMLTPGGALKIIDRKKNLVKLKGGEYVALERMNTAYNTSPFVNVDAGGVCSYADDSLDRSICVAQCKPAELQKVAQKLNLTLVTDAELCAHPKIQAEVLESFKAVAKSAKLTSLETVVAVMPVTADWAGNGCLTATQKLVPKKVFAFHAAELAVLKPKAIR